MEKERSPDRPWRGRHNKVEQFHPEKAEEGTTAPTSKNEQDEATRMPDEEVINNDKTRKGEESVQKSLCPWRFCSFANPTPLAHADASRDVLPRGGTSQSLHLKLGFDITRCAVVYWDIFPE
ncbi:hypothetical protein TNCV_2176901 [Trichonephila clavipes]|uniref:Uncharacterized protein n=1 Tax=Trichonephila clavipes TaxID=2585209 RepID=A0A8X7B8Q5_TRICX|nr:hypothetical protein TNCV_2176901 [Trichonephila clavipes]